MPLIVSSSVDKVMLSKKCDISAKFYKLKAENVDTDEEKLLYYNIALANAKSENIRLDIYNKRVNIYEDLKMYKQSSENKEFIQNEKISTFKKREKSTFHSKLVLNHDKKLTTRKSFKSGTMIAEEEPFCGALLEEALYRRCLYCLKCNNMNLIPCLKCQLAMFCSKKCFDLAKFHHNYECEATQIAKIPFNFGGIQVGLRACFEILDYFNDSVDAMIDFVKTCKNQSKTIFNIDMTKPLNIEKHAAMISLNHFSIAACYDELTKTINDVLEIYPIIGKLFVTETQKDFLMDFLIMQSSLDFIVHYDYKLQVPTALSVNFMYNYMDHSCASNVHSIMDDGRLCYFTKYPIQKNEILSYNHILNFEESDYDIRKVTAKKCYDFDCKCQACTNQFPLLYAMKVYNQDILNIAMHQRNDIPNMKKKDLKHLLKANCKHIDDFYSTNFPCQEIYLLYLNNGLILSKLFT